MYQHHLKRLQVYVSKFQLRPARGEPRKLNKRHMHTEYTRIRGTYVNLIYAPSEAKQLFQIRRSGMTFCYLAAYKIIAAMRLVAVCGS